MNSYDITGKLKILDLHREAAYARLYRSHHPRRRSLWRWFW